MNELFNKAQTWYENYGLVSIPFLQRKFRLNYEKAFELHGLVINFNLKKKND